MEEGEIVTGNPLESKIINATKITGRTNSGLGVGILNATTAKTYATIEDEEGNQREVQTAPLINYNVLALDQSLKNNSYITLLNHNVTRGDGYYNSNLAGTSFRLFDSKENIMVYGKGAWSHQYGNPEKEASGYQSNIGIKKVSGSINYGAWYNLKTDQFNANDLGYMRNNNVQSTGANIEYKLLEPNGRFLNFRARMGVNYQRQFKPGMFKELEINTFLSSKFNNFLETRIWFDYSPIENIDFNEPRTAGRYLVNPGYKNTRLNIQTDSRKKVRLNSWIGYYKLDDDRAREGMSIGIGPAVRINDKLSINTWISADKNNNDIGYVSSNEESINFGVRDVQTVTNMLSTKYAFNNTMDLFFRARHYWSSASYSDFLELDQAGYLRESDYNNDHDVSFNAFNIDMIYTWVFSPASEFSVVWKNAIIDQQSQVDRDYFSNFSKMSSAPVENSISFRVLYYLDYLMLTKKSRNNPV